MATVIQPRLLGAMFHLYTMLNWLDPHFEDKVRKRWTISVCFFNVIVNSCCFFNVINVDVHTHLKIIRDIISRINQITLIYDLEKLFVLICNSYVFLIQIKFYLNKVFHSTFLIKSLISLNNPLTNDCYFTQKRDIRYLLCPAAVSVGHLKKFLRLKYDLPVNYQVCCTEI